MIRRQVMLAIMAVGLVVSCAALFNMRANKPECTFPPPPDELVGSRCNP